ncbi:hypothetical protein E8E78_05660 [Pseudomonas sp. BN505]|nr:hypothetical protein [Pseudomonas sp. BN605]MDH4856091.1 hypothetical protein [Pseudomonas sp. BN505]
MGAGVPAKQATRYMAPASPVFAATAAPTAIASPSNHATRCPQIGENRRVILPNPIRLPTQPFENISYLLLAYTLLHSSAEFPCPGGAACLRHAKAPFCHHSFWPC